MSESRTLFPFLIITVAVILASGNGRAEIPPPPPGGATVVVLPDTQYYYPDQGTGNLAHWLAQMNWIRAHAETHRIAFVLHLGDITDRNDHSETHEAQWSYAETIAGGIMDVAPLALTTGNHDGLDDSRRTLFSEPGFFGPGSRYARQPTLVDSVTPDRLESSAHLFEAADRSWLVLCLEWGPGEDVMAWAEAVLAEHPEREVIVVTHAYLFRDSSRYDWELMGGADIEERQRGNPLGYGGLDDAPGGVYDGQRIWNRLVRAHPRVRLVLSGHVSRSGQGRRVTLGDAGNLVHEKLVNFQHWFEDGGGRMQVLQLHPGGRRMDVRTFRASNGEVIEGPDMQFSLAMPERPVAVDGGAALSSAEPLVLVDPYRQAPERPVLDRSGRIDAFGLPENFAPAPGSLVFAGGAHVDLDLLRAPGPTWTLAGWFRWKDAEPEDGGTPVLQLFHGDSAILDLEAIPAHRSADPVEEDPFRASRTAGHTPLIFSPAIGQWNHFALAVSAEGWTAFLNGKPFPQEGSPPPGPTRIRLGATEVDVGGASWQLSQLALFSRRLDFAELEHLRAGALFARRTSRIDLATGSTDGSAPGISWQAGPDGNLQATVAELAPYRVTDVPGRSRDLYSRFLPLNRTLDYTDGVLLFNVTNADADTVAFPAVRRTADNPWEGRFFGSRYGGTRRSVLNLNGLPEAPGTGAGARAAFFPFHGDWPGGHVSGAGVLLQGHALLPYAAVNFRFQDRRYLLPALAHSREDAVPLAQSASPLYEARVAPEGDGWQLEMSRTDRHERGARQAFSFLFAKTDNTGSEAGWFEPGMIAPTSPWMRTGEGRYRTETYAGRAGVLLLTPGIPGSENTTTRLLEPAPGIYEVQVNRKNDGSPIDGAFAWAWIPDVPDTGEAAPGNGRSRVERRLLDAAWTGSGWGYSRKFNWFYAEEVHWPWVFLPEHGWLYLFFSTEHPEGFWAYSRPLGEILYFHQYEHRWAFSYSRGWFAWPIT